MPIYIVEGDDHRQITTDDLAHMLKIDSKILAKIEKNPVFEINPIKKRPDKLNGGFISPAGKGQKPVIFVKVDPKTGIITDKPGALQKTIRYATSIVPDKDNDRISHYEPKRLNFYDSLDVVPNLEEALMKYCLPACKDSPVADKRNWHYFFQNKEAAASKINERGALIAKSMALIHNPPENGGLTDTQLLMVAKGLYATNRNPPIIPNPSQRNKTMVEVKADLVELALKDPELFINSCDDDVNEFYGMVMDAADRGIFGVRTMGNTKYWYWEQGPDKGTQICSIGNLSDFDALRGAIEANPNAYYANITRAVTEAHGKESMAEFIRKQKAAEEVKKPNIDPDSFEMPTDYQEIQRLTMTLNGGKRPATKIVSNFAKGVRAGDITMENMKAVLEKMIAEDI